MGNIALATRSVMQTRPEVVLENVLPKDADASDGLGTWMLRMGAGQTTTAPDPKQTGGQYLLVVNGSINFSGANYPVDSAIYLEPTDAALTFRAGANGAEVCVMSFPRVDD
jgi:hypothetical protein